MLLLLLLVVENGLGVNPLFGCVELLPPNAVVDWDEKLNNDGVEVCDPPLNGAKEEEVVALGKSLERDVPKEANVLVVEWLDCVDERPAALIVVVAAAAGGVAAERLNGVGAAGAAVLVSPKVKPPVLLVVVAAVVLVVVVVLATFGISVLAFLSLS